MKGKIFNKNGELVIIYKHYSPGRHEKYSWKSNFYKIYNQESIDIDLWNYVGIEVSFKKNLDIAIIDSRKLKETIREIKINKIILYIKSLQTFNSLILHF